jgi:hypothetical protein
MKNQYFGDINDYFKYGVLRLLAGAERLSVGICWMLTPDDRGTDGRKTRYWNDPVQWRHYDPALFDALAACAANPSLRHVRRASDPGVLSGARFHEAHIPQERAARAAYVEEARTRLRGCDVVFFDPDNGLEVRSCPVGTKSSPKYLYWQEVRAFHADGGSLLIFQHFPHVERHAYVQARMAQLAEHTHATRIYGLLTGNVIFLLAPQARHSAALGSSVTRIAVDWAPHVAVTSLVAA